MKKGSARFNSLLFVFILVAACGSGCSTADPGTRWSRHFDSSVWGGAVNQQFARPDRYLPEATLAAIIPAAYVYDRRIHDHTRDESVNSTTNVAADVIQFVAPAIPLTLGIIDWAGGDEGRHFEVAAESLAAVVTLQQALAWTVRRERPDHEDSLSFPSGHTGWVFAATTLVVRNLHDPSDVSFHPLDTLLYAPAIFTGWERITNNRHWTSDVAVGAFLGVFVTNLIWDAHYRGDGEKRRAIHMDEPRQETGWKAGFGVLEGRLVLSLEVSF